MAGSWKLRGYAVGELLGRGASADVWQATVSATGEPVALKRIRVTDPEQVVRARAEAALLTVLDHPNLIRLHAVAATDDSIVLVLDLAEAGSLDDLLAARGRLTPGEAITALCPIAGALCYLHTHAVVHGDLSAANILFTGSGVAMLGDAGVARLIGDSREVEATPGYVDPSVAAGGLPTPSGDVFSLGAVAFHVLTGAPLWGTGTAEQMLARAARGVPGDVADRLAAAGVPPELAGPVVRALAPEPHRRGSAVELALDLRHAGTPLAIEFTAGRERREVPAAPPPEPRPAIGEPVAAPEAGPDDPARPRFERPGPALPPSGAEPPTHAMQARPRPTIPRQTRRGARTAARARTRRRLVGATAVVALALGGGAAVHLGRAGAGPAASAAASGPPTRATTPAARAASSPVRTGGTDWSAVLSGLGAQRTAAYALRRPALLARVYLPGPLLNSDAEQLARLVPGGCRLTGGATVYRDVRVEPGAEPIGAGVSPPTSATVSALVSVASSGVTCSGRVRTTSAALPPVRLRIELRATAAGPRIAAIRPAR